MSRTISFDDLMDSTIVVDGLELEAKVDVVIRQFKNGDYEIESIDIGDVYLAAGNHNLILLDQSSLRTRNKMLYGRFVNAVELLALQTAKNTPDHKWTDLDQSDDYQENEAV